LCTYINTDNRLPTPILPAGTVTGSIHPTQVRNVAKACLFCKKNLPTESSPYKQNSLSNSIPSLFFLYAVTAYFNIFLYKWIVKKIFDVLYSTLLHLLPLRFHCVEGCWDRTLQDCSTLSLAVRRSYHSVRSHPHISIYIWSFVSDD
jgi:hypothetical protein